jgi:hypothetical protein
VTGADALAAFDLAGAADRAWRSGRPVPVRPTRGEDGVEYEVGATGAVTGGGRR